MNNTHENGTQDYVWSWFMDVDAECLVSVFLGPRSRNLCIPSAQLLSYPAMLRSAK